MGVGLKQGHHLKIIRIIRSNKDCDIGSKNKQLGLVDNSRDISSVRVGVTIEAQAA